MLGINGGEFVLLLVVALVVVGPERLPRYAEQLGVWVRTARRYAQTAKERVTEELGEDVADVDWAALDPRRYDPRRIVREALLDDSPPVAAGGPRTAGASARTTSGRASGAAAASRAAAPAGTAAGASAVGDGRTLPGASVPPVGTPAGDVAGTSPPAATAPFDDEAT